MQNKLFNCDVLVVGAGGAGCAAAVTAAEHGCSTLLIDQSSSLGGTYSLARLNTVCGLYLNMANDHNPQPLPSSFIERWLSKVKTHDKTFRPRREGRLYTAPCNSGLMSIILTELINEQAKKLTYLPNCKLNSVTVADNSITEISASMAGGELLTIIAKLVIDCSGSGAVINHRALSERRIDHHNTLAALPFTLDHCQYNEMLSLKTAYELTQLAEQHSCPHYWRFVVLRKGDNNKINGWFNFPANLFNSATEVKNEIASMLDLLRERLAEFKFAKLNWCGDEVCRRDAPVIDGITTLTGDDIINGTKHPGAILQGNWPIELWDQKNGQQFSYAPVNDFYTIPDDCLRSASCSNLLSAGKGVSATPEAQAAIRVTGLAFATGERAAILAVKSDSSL